MAGGRRCFRSRRLRLGNGILWAARLSQRCPRNNGMATGPDIHRGYHAFPHRCRRRSQSAEPLPTLWRCGDYKGGRSLARSRHAWLGYRGYAMAAVRGRAAQRSGLGRNECRSSQCNRVALVRARTTGSAGNGLQRWEYRRRGFLAAVGGRDRSIGISGRNNGDPLGVDRRLVACASCAVQMTGSMAFIAAAGSSVPLLWLGIVLFGLGFGNSTSLPPLIAQVEFVDEDVPRVVALIVAIAQGAYAFAPAAFGVIRSFALHADGATSGAAPHLFAAAALAQGLAIVAFAAGRRR